jgi:hypothetical protein
MFFISCAPSLVVVLLVGNDNGMNLGMCIIILAMASMSVVVSGVAMTILDVIQLIYVFKGC